MAQYDPVLLSVDKHVALITVNDPDRRNAVTDEMSAQLRAAIQRAEGDPDVHAVVVTGAGKAFCAGADLSALGAGVGDPAEPRLLRLYDGFMAVSSCNLPTIAAVNGAAVGAGLNLALAADVRIAGRPHCSTPASKSWDCIQVAAQPGCCSERWVRRSPVRPYCSACASTPNPLCGTAWR